MPGLSLKVVVRDFYIAQLVLQCSVCVAQSCDLFLESVLGGVGLGPGLLVFSLQDGQPRGSWLAAQMGQSEAHLPLIHLIIQTFGLFPQRILSFLCTL